MKRELIKQSRSLSYLFTALFACTLLLSAPARSDNNAPKAAPFKILLIESQGQDFPFVETLHDAFREAVNEAKPNAQIYTEFLEAVRLSNNERNQALANLIASYETSNLDALVFRGPEAYEFALEHPTLLPDVPHFASTDKPVEMQVAQKVSLSPYIFSAQQSLSEIVRLLNPEQIFLLGSETAGTSAKALEVFQEAAAAIDLSAKLSPLFAANLTDMQSLVTSVPAGSVFLLSPFLFAEDRSLTPRAITEELAKVANAPLFVTHSTLMGTGAIGGSLFSAAASGKALAETVLGLPQSGGTQTLMYDGEALARWGISPEKLEPYSVLSTPYPPLSKISKVVILGDMLTAPTRTQRIIDGFVSAHKASDSSVDYVVINSGAARLNENPDSPILKAQLDSIIGYDAVITTWVNELKFMTRQLPEKFVINLAPAIDNSSSQVINVGQDLPERTLRTAQLALQLPNRNGKAIVLLGDFADNTTATQMLEKQIRNAGFEKVRFISEGDPVAVVEQLKPASSSDTIFYLPFSYLPAEFKIETSAFAAYLAERTDAPLFTMHSAFVGRGAVGGHVFKPDIGGQRAFDAIRDLNSNNQARGTYTASQTVVDQQAFERFGGVISDLPSSAEIINIPDNMSLSEWFDRNKTTLLVALLLLSTVSLLYLRERTQRIRFNLLNKKLSRAAETQKEMFAVVGHELRTPVATIAMVIDDDDRPQSDKLRTIGDISRNLLSVLEDLRTVVDPNRAKEAQYARSKPVDVIQRALTPLSQIIRDKAMQLHFAADAQLDQHYYYREQALRQLVTNLVKNAAIHSGGTNIWVSLEPISDAEDDCVMRLEVADDGRGIEANQLERLFSPFSRGAESKDGAGLGLYIGTELAKALGGELKYNRRPEGGSSFSLQFALQKAKATQPEPMPEPEKPSKNLQGMRILFAEDDLTLRMLTEKSLGKAGAQVESFANGRLALDAFDSSKYDLVLTDLMMPQMDGHQLIRQLRSRGETVPIIVVTAAVVGKETEQLMDEGATGIISKPISPEKLMELL